MTYVCMCASSRCVRDPIKRITTPTTPHVRPQNTVIIDDTSFPSIILPTEKRNNAVSPSRLLYT